MTPIASALSPVTAAASPVDAAAVADDAPRVYAKTRFVWIYPEADASRQWIGYFRTGNSLRLRSAKPRPGPACPTAFYEVEPWGFVCADGARATLDQNDPRYRALAPFAAKADTPWPYHYAESLGSARYFSLPTPELQRLREGDFRAHWRDVEAARAGQVPATLLGVDVSVPAAAPPELPPLPPTVFEDREALGRRSTIAYSAEGRVADRAFVLSADYAWVPKDRIRPYPSIAFHGLELSSGVKLPLAFFRNDKRSKFHRDASGAFTPSPEAFERLSYVELTGESVRAGEERYFQTREPGVWLRERDAVLPKPQPLTPWGASVGAEDSTGKAPKGRATWIEVSIEGGWLLAFEGTRPVFTTLISPGKGGVAAPGEDPLKRSATPTGTFPISGKFVTSTMEAPGDLIHSDVPFAQNLVGPYALHGAYWHDNWGRRQSGGCINLSPIDAKWMFDFTEPRLPTGWYGVRWRPDKGPATVVILHR